MRTEITENELRTYVGTHADILNAANVACADYYPEIDINGHIIAVVAADDCPGHQLVNWNHHQIVEDGEGFAITKERMRVWFREELDENLVSDKVVNGITADLLEALKACQAYMLGRATELDLVDTDRLAQAAIAKAEGGE